MDIALFVHDMSVEIGKWEWQERVETKPIPDGVQAEQMQNMVQADHGRQELQAVQKQQAAQGQEAVHSSVLDEKAAGVSYLRLRKNLVCSICTTDNIYVADDIEVPFVLGVELPLRYWMAPVVLRM